MINHRKLSMRGWLVLLLGMAMLAVMPIAGAKAEERETHPPLSDQEMLTPCADCHREATPEVERQWYDSKHGIAMVKCYQCHGTFETFAVTPDRATCATCHADMLAKCQQDQACWECHTPHVFKEKK